MQAYVSPGKPTGYVSDFAGVISTSQKQEIESKLSALEKNTGNEVAVVTVKSLGGDTVENFALKLFQEWGIGSKKNNNGVLILVAPTEREVRIEVGYGLEGAITDLQSGNIIRQVMIPAFKTGDYGAGISRAADAVTAIIMDSPEAARYLESAPRADSIFATIENNLASVIFVFIIVLNIFGRLLRKSKSWWLGGVIGGVIGYIVGLFWGGLVTMVILIALGLIYDYIVSKHGGGPGTHLPFWMGGTGGQGLSGGGGFGGFGGGLSGGGGASGRW